MEAHLLASDLHFRERTVPYRSLKLELITRVGACRICDRMNGRHVAADAGDGKCSGPRGE